MATELQSRCKYYASSHCFFPAVHFHPYYNGISTLVRLAAISLQISLLVLLLVPGARGQAVVPAYYSTGAPGVAYQVTQPSSQVIGSGNVVAGANATDNDFATFATLRTDATASVGVPVGLLMKLTGTAPAGYRAGVVLANPSCGLQPGLVEGVNEDK